MKPIGKATSPSTEEPAYEPSEPSPAPHRIAKFRYEQFTPNTLIENLSYMLIRPPKLIYDPKDLEVAGPQRVSHNHAVHQIPFELSLYLPKKAPPRYVVLYLHCNSSNRMEGQTMLKYLPADVGLACFDFQGCGNRAGKWVTLGVEESKEADIAAKWLKQRKYVVVGWGRSMGSVSLLMSTECNVMVADSPFCNLTRLCRESGQYIPYLPYCIFNCFFPCVFCCVRKDIQSKTQQDILEVLEVERVVEQISPNKSIIFLSGDKDTMIDKKHSEVLYQKFRGHKQLEIFPGSHNSTRTEETMRRVFNFIDASLLRQQVLHQPTDNQQQPATPPTQPLAKKQLQPMEITNENLNMPPSRSPSNITLSVQRRHRSPHH